MRAVFGRNREWLFFMKNTTYTYIDNRWNFWPIDGIASSQRNFSQFLGTAPQLESFVPVNKMHAKQFRRAQSTKPNAPKNWSTGRANMQNGFCLTIRFASIPSIFSCRTLVKVNNRSILTFFPANIYLHKLFWKTKTYYLCRALLNMS